MQKGMRLGLRDSWLTHRVGLLIALVLALLGPHWVMAVEADQSERPNLRGQECQPNCRPDIRQNPFFERALADLLSEESQRVLPGMEWDSLSMDQQKRLADLIRGYDHRARIAFSRVKALEGALHRFELIRSAVQGELQNMTGARDELAKLLAVDQDPSFFRLQDEKWTSVKLARGSVDRRDLQEHLDDLGDLLALALVRVHMARGGDDDKTREWKALAAVVLTDVYVLSAIASKDSHIAHYAAIEQIILAGGGYVGLLGGVWANVYGFNTELLASALGGFASIEFGLFVMNIWRRDDGGTPILPSKRARNRAQKATFEELTMRFWHTVGHRLSSPSLEVGSGGQNSAELVREHSSAVWEKIFGDYYHNDRKSAKALAVTQELIGIDFKRIGEPPFSLDGCLDLLRSP